MLLTAATIFVGAFLLFLVEPLIAKIILPWFGGSAAVWATCLLFFQVELLLGYLYAHALASRLAPRKQAEVHLGVLALSVLALPLLSLFHWRPRPFADPSPQILCLLLLKIGLPFLALSATGPLLQAWAAGGEKGGFPYRLYALSNIGSMLALLCYPFVVEPALSLRAQALTWTAAYIVYAALCAAVAGKILGSKARAEEAAGEDGEAPGWSDKALWLALSACGSVLLLAVTNHLSQNVAAIPFLWLLPLGLYLLSFIVCFGPSEWTWEKAFLPFPAMALGAMAYALSIENGELKLLLPVFCAGLFVCCVFCHGELARRKPHPRHLTSFYLMLSVGGALGGLFVSLGAPHLFRDFYELPIGIGACAVLAWGTLYREEPVWWGPSWLVLGALTATLGVYLVKQTRERNSDDILRVRNFYGVLHVTQEDLSQDDAKRTLTHGTIMHGEQYLKPERHMWPTTYYGPSSGIGLAVQEARSRGPLKIGVIGLGTGSMAAWGRAGDSISFYDINPLVVDVARTQFTYLKDTPAKVEIVPGDARLSLESEPPRGYDILVVDAFSSDAIPVHLLTREAFELYFRHLKEGGVLAVHVSNRYLDLEPVVLALAESLGKQARNVDSDDDESKDIAAADWVLVTSRQSFFDSPQLADAATAVERRPGLRLWTDDYSNLYQILK